MKISGLAAGITIEADDLFRHLQVYTPPDQDFFCVEPVSHVPNALNLRELSPDQAMDVVQPGATLSGSITIGYRSPSASALLGRQRHKADYE